MRLGTILAINILDYWKIHMGTRQWWGEVTPVNQFTSIEPKAGILDGRKIISKALPLRRAPGMEILLASTPM